MLDAKVNTFLDVAVAHDLVHDDTDGMGGNVVDHAGSSSPRNLRLSRVTCCIIDGARDDVPVVVFMGHTLLLSRVSFDVDDIAYAIGDEVSR